MLCDAVPMAWNPAFAADYTTATTCRIISAGVDGAVYEWRVSTMRRERENVLKVGGVCMH